MNKSHANTSTCTKPTMSFCRAACWMKFTFSPWRHHWRTTATCIVVYIPCAPQFENCFTWFQEYVIETTPATTNIHIQIQTKKMLASPGYEQKTQQQQRNIKRYQTKNAWREIAEWWANDASPKKQQEWWYSSGKKNSEISFEFRLFCRRKWNDIFMLKRK